ncbi:MAG: VWA domain-containing protein [Cyclobacteriaceae bacterium]|nr:VWA domain-containing protein [Cyclobacteriaceae bacterium]
MRASLLLFLVAIFLVVSCTEMPEGTSGSASAELLAFAGGRGGTSSGSGSGTGSGQSKSGVITAAEWNDLNHWNFWKELIESDEFSKMPTYWSFFHSNRISVRVRDGNGNPATNVLVQLKRESGVVFTAVTDNSGMAELWIDLFQKKSNVDLLQYRIDVGSGLKYSDHILPFEQGINEFVIPQEILAQNRIEVSFVVDATGSMGDELEYLKTELYDVITRSKANNPNSTVSLSSVFYRDIGDEYVTKLSPFTSDVTATIDFIKKQSAAGGGDFPEAVHTALDKAINELQWTTEAKTKLIFLMLDAPPHYDNEVIANLQLSVMKASLTGIKIIPITASGIDKETEFLMRFMAISTQGTYVFITDDSGIGNEHLKASVGEYEVEYLNDLMVRLIDKYSSNF